MEIGIQRVPRAAIRKPLLFRLAPRRSLLHRIIFFLMNALMPVAMAVLYLDAEKA
jgi:hypothetical protein